MTDVTHYPDDSRFEAGAAYLSYERSGSTLTIEHTIVPPDLGGQGVGGQLVEDAVTYARSEGLEVTATCSFARTWLERRGRAGG